jgi:hypothetical protein
MNDMDIFENSEREQYYEVEKIVDKRIDGSGRIFYLVKWEGYPDEEMTWEPIENLETVLELVRNFEISQLQKENHSGNLLTSEDYSKYPENVINTILEDNTNHSHMVKFKQDAGSNFNYKNDSDNFNKIDSYLGESLESNYKNKDLHKFHRNLKTSMPKKGNSPQVKRKRGRKKKVAVSQYYPGDNLKSSHPKFLVENDSKYSSDIKTRSALLTTHGKTIAHVPAPEDYLKWNSSVDKPKCLNFAKLVNGEMHFWVTWDSRTDGTTPDDQLVPHQLIKQHYPYVLIDFYEDRLRFGNVKISASTNNRETQDLILEQLNSKSQNEPLISAAISNPNVNSTGVNFTEGEFSNDTPSNSNINSANEMLLEN